MGVFGGYTRWAVVFLIIFVLFFLLCPVYGYVAPTTQTVTMTEYDATAVAGYELGGYPGTMTPGSSYYYGDSSSSSM